MIFIQVILVRVILGFILLLLVNIIIDYLIFNLLAGRVLQFQRRDLLHVDGIIVLAVLVAVEVELVHRLNRISNLVDGQAVGEVLVNDNQEVAVPVSHVTDHEVTLVVVKIQTDKVVPARDHHVVDVTDGDHVGMYVVNGMSLDDIFNLVAGGELLYQIGNGGQAGLAIGDANGFDVLLLAGNGIPVPDGVNLRHFVTGHFVE